jgi:hypothetical protein
MFLAGLFFFVTNEYFGIIKDKTELHLGKPGPTRFAFAVDECVLVEQRLADLDAAVLGRKMESAPTFEVKNVHSAVVIKKDLEKKIISLKPFFIFKKHRWTVRI